MTGVDAVGDMRLVLQRNYGRQQRPLICEFCTIIPQRRPLIITLIVRWRTMPFEQNHTQINLKEGNK